MMPPSISTVMDVFIHLVMKILIEIFVSQLRKIEGLEDMELH